jgi:outer membrane receptor for ferrienterochelin and colicins
MGKRILILLFFGPLITFGQSVMVVKDTLASDGDSVVVTATRSERKLSNITVPVTIINAKTIQQNGALRLTDILN